MSFLQLLIKLSSVNLINSVLLLLSSLILGKLMSPNDFGTYSYYQSILMLLLNIVPFGSGLAVVVFLFKSPQRKLDRVMSNTICVLLPAMTILCLFVVYLLLFFTGKDIKGIYVVILLNVLVMSICLTSIDYLRCKQDIKKYSILITLFSVSTSIFSVVGYYFWSNINMVFLSVSFGLLFPLFYSLKVILDNFSIDYTYKKKLKTFSWSVKYGLPVVLQTTIMSFLVIGDKIILGGLISEEKLAEYSIAALLSSTSLFIVNNFSSSWGGHLFKSLPSLTHEQLRRDYSKYKVKLLFFIPAALSLIIGQWLIYKLFFESSYADITPLIFILTSAYSLLGVSKYFTSYLNYFGKNYYIVYSAAIGSLVMLALSVFIMDVTIINMGITVLLGMFTHLTIVTVLCDRIINTNTSSQSKI